MSCLVMWGVIAGTLILALLAAEADALHLTVKQSVEAQSSDYWKAFLNISYYNPEKKVWHTDRSETGRYSNIGDPKEVEGVVVEMKSYNPLASSNSSGVIREDTLTGCNPPFRENKIPKSGESWIAIIRRGHCSFQRKIQNAVKLNASGVLIYDNQGDGGDLMAIPSVDLSSDTSSVGSRGDDDAIPVVFTYNFKGEEIVNLVRRYNRVLLKLHKSAHCKRYHPADSPLIMHSCRPLDDWEDGMQWAVINGGQINRQTFDLNRLWKFNLTGLPPYHAEKRTSVLFVSVSFMILMLISLAWLVFYYIQRFRYIHAKDQRERKLTSQAKRALAIISTSVLKKEDFENKDFNDTCAVCIENYRISDVVRILPCKHLFHKSCIDQWLLEKRTCPMCKMDILQHYGMIAAETEQRNQQPTIVQSDTDSANFA